MDWLGDSPDLWVPDLHLDLDQAGSNHQSELMIVSIALSLYGLVVPWLHGYMVLHGYYFALYSIDSVNLGIIILYFLCLEAPTEIIYNL